MPTYEERRRWLPWAAIVAVGVILLCFVWPFPALKSLALLTIVVAMASGLFEVYRAFKKRDPFDLQSLNQEVEQDETRRQLEDEVAVEADRILCMCCQEEYDAKYPICPHCGRSSP